jgi:hypothetical protein
MKQYQALAIFCCLLSFLSIFGCSSGGGGGDGGPASGGGGTALPITSVMVAPSTVSVRVGQTQQLAAVVQGTGNFSNAVTWAVNNVAGGNATVGTISATGLYTAPATVPSPNPVTVTAVSVADSTKSGTAQVTVQAEGAVTTVRVQGRVDDGLAHSPIANANCSFRDLQGTSLTMATADDSGAFLLFVLPGVPGFIRCTPPALSNLGLSAFASTIGRTAGETITDLTVSPATTMLADILATTNPSDLQARATALTNALAAGDADLTLLAEAITTQYNALLARQINVSFSGESEGGDGPGDGDGRGDGDGPGDGGGTGGDAGDGGAFSPIPNAFCTFALDLDGPTMTNAALADFLATGTVNRPDLQTIAAEVNTAFAGRQVALVAAFRRQFPNGLGQPIATTADANGSYFLRTPPGVQGFVRCNPPDAANLALARFVRARQPGERLMGQNVTPVTTQIGIVVTQGIDAGLDAVTLQNIQDSLLTAVAPLQIFLSNWPTLRRRC